MIKIKEIKTLKELETIGQCWSKAPSPNGDLSKTFKSGRRLVLGAYDGENPVGTVSLVFKRKDLDVANGIDIAEINALQIKPEYRGGGLSGRLMRELFKKAKTRGIKRVTLGVEEQNRLAHQIYLHWDFKEFKQKINDKGVKEFYLYKKI